MNKSELKHEIIKLTSEYLGFSIAGVAGLSSMNKSALEIELKEIKRALRFKKYAKKIHVDRLKGYFASEGSQIKIQFKRVQLLEFVADRLWHKASYEQAKREAISAIYD